MSRRHRSFVLTQPEYMEGKRVIPRLRYLAYASIFFVLVEVIVCFAGGFIVAENFGGPRGGWIGVAIFGVMLFMIRLIAHLTFFALGKLFVRLDLLTPDQAQSLLV